MTEEDGKAPSLNLNHPVATRSHLSRSTTCAFGSGIVLLPVCDGLGLPFVVSLFASVVLVDLVFDGVLADRKESADEATPRQVIEKAGAVRKVLDAITSGCIASIDVSSLRRLREFLVENVFLKAANGPDARIGVQGTIR